MSEEFLQNIIDHKKMLLDHKREFYNGLKEAVVKNDQPHIFKEHISRPGQVNLIAEIKKASPSKGTIREDFDPVAIAKIYEAHHAAAISVLTEDRYFLGSPDFIKEISADVSLPLLTKDFIIDERQIFEAAINGSKAILLIVAILDDQKLAELIATATSLGLDCLVEVHNEHELERACKVEAEIIGINNRNLKTFEVDIGVCIDLIPKVPKNKILVAESGFKLYQDIQILKDLGVHAVLIGEVLMKAEDIGAKVDEIMKS